MQQKLTSINYHRLLTYLRDVRVIGLIGFGIISLLVTWSGVGVLQTNYELQQRIVALEQAIALQELETQNQALRNAYYETDQFLELQARRQFGLAAPGETVLIVPESVALANSFPEAEPPTPASDTDSGRDDKPQYQRNIEAWVEFFTRGFRPGD